MSFKCSRIIKPMYKVAIVISLISAAATGVTAIVSAAGHSGWGIVSKPPSVDDPSTAPLPLQTTFNDGCPFQAPDGLALFLASNRTGTLGGQDIWVATRDSANDPWGEPIHLPFPINTDRDDFCPSPVQGHGLFFVSKRFIPGVSCGADTGNMPASDTDIYFTRYAVRKGGVDWGAAETWDEPFHLPCNDAGGPNSSAQEWSPSYFEGDDGAGYLYFSSLRDVGPRIYQSVNMGAALPVPELNAGGNAHRPNVRKDGLEIVFDSNRPGFVGSAANFDIWTATRECAGPGCPWSAPVHLPEGVNSPQDETRATLSWDGLTLFFGSSRTAGEGGPTLGAGDIYTTTRTKLKGNE